MKWMNYVRLGDVIATAKTDRCGENSLPILSITKSDGIILQSEKFKKRIASVDTANYKVVHRGQLVQGIHIDEANFGIQEVTDVGIVSPAYKIWNIRTDKIIPKFLEIVLRTRKSTAYYASRFNGSIKRRERISDKDFLSMEIPCPPMTEQQYAVDLISKVTTLVVQRMEQITILDELIKARFIELFGDPVQNPFRWSTRPLLEMGYCKNGMNFHTGDRGIEMHCLGVGDFKNYSVIDGTDHLPIISLNEEPPEESMLQDGDIVFVRSNGNKALVGRCLVVYPHSTPTTYSGFCIRYRLTSNAVNRAYLLRVLKADSMRQRMAGRGANIQNLNQQILAALEIPTPPKDLQEQFAAFVAQTDKSKVTGVV